jgi:hypothetical protein
METLKLNAPLETREPQVQLDPTLRPGRYVAQLVVKSSNGTSEPAQIVINVTRGD